MSKIHPAIKIIFISIIALLTPIIAVVISHHVQFTNYSYCQEIIDLILTMYVALSFIICILLISLIMVKEGWLD